MDPRALHIEDFTYDLPQERIAQRPLGQRDASRLLVFDRGRISDVRFNDLPSLLPAGSLVVLNSTRVVKARIHFRRATGALIECMVLAPADGGPVEHALQERRISRWRCMVGNARRWKKEPLFTGTGEDRLSAEHEMELDGDIIIRFIWSSDRTFAEMLAMHGHMPLPPYMKREAEGEDDARYNTVFAVHDGSVAAPTASLHFTPELLAQLAVKGTATTEVTLHVGAGTFLPVKSQRMAGHTMHREQVHIPRATIERLLTAIGRSPIVPVGTTALRTIESLCWFGDDLLRGDDPDHLHITQWRPYEAPPAETRYALEAALRWMDARGTDTLTGSTELLIAPGYPFRLATGLITNFHQPGSTLLLLVAAFIGERWREVYDHALAHGYRFLSYGDGSLLWRTGPMAG